MCGGGRKKQCVAVEGRSNVWRWKEEAMCGGGRKKQCVAVEGRSNAWRWKEEAMRGGGRKKQCVAVEGRSNVWRWKEEAMCGGGRKKQCVAVEGRSNVCKIHMHSFKSHFQRDFLACCTRPVCAFGDGVCQLLIQQFFSLFAQFKTKTKSHENYVFLYPFSNMAISPQNKEENLFYSSKLYGLTGMMYFPQWINKVVLYLVAGVCRNHSLMPERQRGHGAVAGFPGEND